MRHALIALIAVLLAVGSAPASSIGVYFDQAATLCEASIPIYTQFTWYHCARLDGFLEEGFTGAEYQQTGTPDGWIVSVVPNVNATVHLGNPLEGGTNIAFNQCQNGPDGVVLLETITGFATSEVTDVELRIEPHTAPSNPNQQCVNLINCSSPFFTRFCVDGSSAIINKVHSQACEPLGTQPSSWAGVKSLYQQ